MCPRWQNRSDKYKTYLDSFNSVCSGRLCGLGHLTMFWYQNDDEEEDLLYSPALMARRASESWIDTPPVENLVEQTSLQRKKSLPDVQVLPKATGGMSREEVSTLGSARREEVRRMADEKERLRANPLLYLVSPQVKDWFSRQQLVIIILFVNISLAIMFFKLLT